MAMAEPFSIQVDAFAKNEKALTHALSVMKIVR